MASKPIKKVKRKLAQPNWRDTSDALLHGYPSWPSPESLHPDDYTILKAAAGSPTARAIADSFACRLPVTIVETIKEGEVICPI